VTVIVIEIDAVAIVQESEIAIGGVAGTIGTATESAGVDAISKSTKKVKPLPVSP